MACRDHHRANIFKRGFLLAALFLSVCRSTLHCQDVANDTVRSRIPSRISSRQQVFATRPSNPLNLTPNQVPDRPAESNGPLANPPGISIDPDSNAELRPLTETLSLNVAPRELSLRDAIQISLEKSDVVRTLGGAGVQIEPVTGYDPAIMQTRSNVASTVFDPKLNAGYLGSRINEPDGTFFGPGITQQVRRDEGGFTASVSKTWAAGTTTSIGYLPPLGYLFYPNGLVGQFNPVFTSDLVVQIQQPLMRGAGWTVNLAPIHIAQLRTEQSVWDCKQATLAQVRSVETAYWDLQAALVTVDAMESILPLMSEIVRIEGHRAQSELSTSADVARASMQFDQLQQQRFQVRNDAVAKELRLRNLLALDIADNTRIVTIDIPRREPVALNYSAALSNAIEHRPDLVRQRLGVRIRELEYAIARNGLKPQLDLQALYRSNGIGQDLSTSLQQMVGFQYSDWTLGATFSIPLGNRAAKANLETAELQLRRDRAVLQQSMQNIGFILADLIRETGVAHSQFELAVGRVRKSQEWIRSARIRYSSPPPSADGNQNWLLLALYDYQNALKMNLDASTDAGQLLSKYNSMLARLDEAQGILLENRGIEFSNDPCKAVRQHAHELFGPVQSDASIAKLQPQTPSSTVIRDSALRQASSTDSESSIDSNSLLPQPGHSFSPELPGRPANYSTFRRLQENRRLPNN